MIRVTGAFFILTICWFNASSQSVHCEPGQRVVPGNVQMINTYTIDTLTAGDPMSEEEMEEGVKMRGYRVQVYAGSDRRRAEQLKDELSNIYSTVYLVYDQPYFKIRIGDYRSRLEAQHMLHELKIAFPETLLVPDDINLPALD
ncbi:MAG: SPOR domain-containing protein [Bacteroidota bacterium]|nr:SPOR domain-containing protein [Bacteroidota bacterium]